MSSWREVAELASEIMATATHCDYYSVVDILNFREDLDRNQKQDLLEYFQEWFEHDPD